MTERDASVASDARPKISTEDQHAAAQTGAAVFEDIQSHGIRNYLMRSVHSGQIQMSAIADMKANMMITISSIVISITASQIQNETYRIPLLILCGFCLVSLFLAVMCVLPKYSAQSSTAATRSNSINPLFFGQFSHWDIDEFNDEMAHILKEDSRVYQAFVRDIYGLGCSLARGKFRYLRWSYMAFLAGVVSSVVCLVAITVVHTAG